MKTRPKILVVDDDTNIAAYIAGLLEGYGYEVLIADSGVAALSEIYREKDLSVILLDIIMPGMNGFDVLNEMKNHQVSEPIKVIMVSGKSDVTEKVKAFSLGASDYIEKPFATDELLMRVQTQVRLRKTESELLLFKTIIDASKEAISISDSENRLVYVNSAYENMISRTSEEILGRDASEIYPVEVREKLRQQICSVIIHGEGWEGELDIVSPDGKVIPVWQRIGCINDDEGKPTNTFCFMHDISERIEIIEAWRKYAFMANASKDLMTLVNKEYVYEAANDAYCSARRSVREEIVGSTMEDLWDMKFDTLIKEYMDGCFSGQEVHYEDWFEFDGKEKRCFDVAYYPYRDSNNEITHAVVVSRDITERKKVEQSLLESQQYVERIADTQPDLLLIYNLEKNLFEYCNHQLEIVLGYEKERIISSKINQLLDYFHPDDLFRINQITNLLERSRNQEIVDMEFRLKDVNNEWHWFYGRSTVFARFSDGQPRKLLSIVQDITTRKETEKALRMYQIQLTRAEKMAAVGRLLAAIMHEINNPLQAVQSCLSLISEEIACAGKTEKIKDYLEVASSEVDRISEVILRSRNFYQPIQSKHQELGDEFYRGVQFQTVNLYELVQKVIKLISAELKNKHISILFDCDDCLYNVHGHRDSLEQVLMNVIINAVDAMELSKKEHDIGGTLLIKLNSEKLSQLQKNQRDKPVIRLEISDSGIGMNTEVLEKAFEPFFTTKETGSGLGLATCHQIVRAHEGIIELESEPGMGTTVTILLPAERKRKGS